MASTHNRSSLANHPYLLMGMLLILWGSFTAASKLTLQSIDSFQLQFYMFGSAFLFMTTVLIFNGKTKRLFSLSRNELATLVLYSLPSYLYYFLYVMALQLIPAIEASMLNYMFPILIVLLSVPMHGERLTTAVVFSCLFGFAGMLIIVSGGNLGAVGFTNAAGDLLAIGAAFCWALFSNLGKRNFVDREISNYVYTGIAFLLSCISVISFSEFVVPTRSALSLAVWIGISNIAVAYYLWFKALQSSSASLIAGMSFLTPFFTFSYIVIFLNEKFASVHWVGLLFMVAGLVILHAGSRKKKEALRVTP